MAGLDRGHTHSTMQPKVATYLAIWAEHCGTAGGDRSSPFRCVGAITGLRVPVCGGGAWKKRREPARPPGRAGFGAVAPTNESHAASRRIGRSFRGARTWPPRGASRRSGASGGGRPYHWIRAADHVPPGPGDLSERKAGSCGQNRRRCSLWNVCRRLCLFRPGSSVAFLQIGREGSGAAWLEKSTCVGAT
jgi:hypothetical protein